MIKLEPLQQQEYDRYLEKAIREYAEDHVRNGNWPAESALERSRKDFERYLPDGLHTPDQYLWSLVNEEQKKIGLLWVQVKEKKAFVFDFRIDEMFRGKGYGKQALAAMDEWLRSMDVESVALHVFGDNLIAQELYKKSGFEISDMQMRKKLK